MGWSSFKERIEKGKFNFMKKIEGLDRGREMDKENPDGKKGLFQMEKRVGRLEKEGEFGGGVMLIRSKGSPEKSRGEWQREMETGDGKQDNPEMV